jgi:DNA-binding MarR family transcriptional regulator
MSAPLGDADYQRLLAFRTELRAFLRWSEQAATNAGLTSSIHQLLLVVRGSDSPGGPTVGEVADSLHVRHHSAVELAQRADALGLLRRERDPLDHRRMHLRLTEDGRARLETLTREHLSRIGTLADALEVVARQARLS